MPTFIKTGFWDKLINNNPQKAKAPIGWLNLDKFVESKIPPTPPPPSSVNIYNSDGTLTGNRTINGSNKYLQILNTDFFNVNSNGRGVLNIGQNNTNIGIQDTTYTTNILNFQLGYLQLEANGIVNGIKLDTFNKIYQFGQITGGNTKTFKIDDTAAFGFQFSGTGITQATTGAASGQYLKVNVGGNDYVIELKNPS